MISGLAQTIAWCRRLKRRERSAVGMPRTKRKDRKNRNSRKKAQEAQKITKELSHQIRAIAIIGLRPGFEFPSALADFYLALFCALSRLFPFHGRPATPPFFAPFVPFRGRSRLVLAPVG